MQWIIISVTKSVAASLLMSFLGIYATAIFAARHGFRVPVEGVPFLSFVIAIITFSAFICTMLMFSIMMFLFWQIKTLVNMTFDEFSSAMSHVSMFSAFSEEIKREIYKYFIRVIRALFRWVFSRKIMLWIAGVLLVMAVSILLDTNLAEIFVTSYYPGKLQPAEIVVGLIACSIVAVSLWCVSNELSWIAAQIFASILIFSVMAFGLFANDAYGSFLRIIRYGGGIRIIVRYMEGDKGQTEISNGYLMLITATHILVFEPDRSAIKEIVLRNATSIEYGVQPKWSLPEYDLSKQREYLQFDLIGADQKK